jgi:hypothetical protein
MRRRKRPSALLKGAAATVRALVSPNVTPGTRANNLQNREKFSQGRSGSSRPIIRWRESVTGWLTGQDCPSDISVRVFELRQYWLVTMSSLAARARSTLRPRWLRETTSRTMSAGVEQGTCTQSIVSRSQPTGISGLQLRAMDRPTRSAMGRLPTRDRRIGDRAGRRDGVRDRGQGRAPAGRGELLIPAGAIHSARNIGKTTARWLCGYKR